MMNRKCSRSQVILGTEKNKGAWSQLCLVACDCFSNISAVQGVPCSSDGPSLGLGVKCSQLGVS